MYVYSSLENWRQGVAIGREGKDSREREREKVCEIDTGWKMVSDPTRVTYYRAGTKSNLFRCYFQRRTPAIGNMGNRRP